MNAIVIWNSVATLVICALAVYVIAHLNERDMRVCQLTHSHTTCFIALNR